MVNRFVLNTISYHGSSAIKEIPGEIQHHGYTKEFVCSDPDLVKFGITDMVTNLLDEAKIPWSLYSETKPNSTIHNVQDSVVAFKKFGADMIVAIGGSARAAGVIAENSEFFDVVSLEGVAPTKKHATFALAAPITAGTEAEVTINYVIADPKEARKFVCVGTNDISEITVVDPDRMASVPAVLTAATGMDAPTHAIEGYTTTAALEPSDMFRYKATEAISHNLRDAYAEPKRRAVRKWRLASASRAGASRTSAWASTTQWRISSLHTMTPRTALSAQCSCRSQWGSTSRPWLTAWQRSPLLWASTLTVCPPTLPQTPQCTMPLNPRDASHDEIVELFCKVMLQAYY